MCVHIDANQKDELRHEKAATQVLVDGCPGALNLTEEPEGEDTHEQADNRDHHSQLSDATQDVVVCGELRRQDVY